MGIALPSSFLVSFVRSASISFQGLWLIIMGFMLWTPEFMPKGCYMNLEEGHDVVRCSNHEALHRAKSLVTIEFAWLLILVSVLSVSLYLILVKIYGNNTEYQSLRKDIELGEESDGAESQITSRTEDTLQFVQDRDSFAPFNIGR
ncbi:hypothetical protein MLD38_007360 [Melastoma candidum]|nr:hypothetical protein MLD38_007360 [Melastoma candidum]